MALGEQLVLTVISADSRQIYRGFDIGTAKPTAAERAHVPHACLDLAEPTTRFTAYAWAASAEAAIADADGRERLPLVVGGAGFYIRALVHPVSAAAPAGFDRVETQYLLVDPGAPLRNRIGDRAASMAANGWPEEVDTLNRQVPAHAPAWQASGYRDMRAYVDGEISLPAAVERVTIATRQYAKRQRTWFRHQLPADRVTHLNPDDSDAVAQAVAWISRFTIGAARAR
jgi:tRNA dimethylallyltransferase